MARAGFCHELRNKNERFWTFEKACWSIPRAHHYSITPLSQVHLLSLLEHTVLLQWQDLIFSPADWYSQRCREHHHAQNLLCVRNRGSKGGREGEYWWETGGEKWLLLCCQTVSKPTLASLSGDEPHTKAEAWQTLKIYSCFPKSSSCSFRVKTFFFFSPACVWRLWSLSLPQTLRELPLFLQRLLGVGSKGEIFSDFLMSFLWRLAFWGCGIARRWWKVFEACWNCKVSWVWSWHFAFVICYFGFQICCFGWVNKCSSVWFTFFNFFDEVFFSQNAE